MHLLPLVAILVLIFSTTLLALNTTTTTTTTKAPIITCDKQAQCPNTQFCFIKQHVCMLKFSVNSTCQDDRECSGNKCYDRVCRQPCKSHNNCSLTKEYCTISNYCQSKHCGLCLRDVQCANNYCHFAVCGRKNCTTALDALNKRT